MILIIGGKIVLLSVLPAFLISSILLSSDKSAGTSRKFYLKMITGGLVALIPASFLIYVLKPLFIDLIPFGVLLSPFLIVAFIEETAKFSVIYLLLKRTPYGRDQYGAILYSSAAAIGFASGENILYLTGTASPLPVIFMRSISALPLHTLCGAFMGLYLWRSVKAEKSPTPLIILVPLFCHGLYNTITKLPDFWPLLNLPLLAIMLFFLLKQLRSE